MLTDPYFLITLFVAFVIFSLGTAVVVRDAKKKINIAFFVVCLSFTAWIPTNYLSNLHWLSHDASLLLNHLTLLFGSLAVFAVLYFSLVISNTAERSVVHKLYRYMFLIGIMASFFAMSPYVVEDIIQQGDVFAVQFGPGAPVYFAVLAVGILSIFANLLSGLFNSHGINRLRILAVVYGLTGTILFAAFTNIVLPSLFNNFALTNLGPLGSVLFISGLMYAIAKHRLFDIRLLVARSLAYILSIAVIVILFVLLTVGIMNGLLSARMQLTVIQSLTFVSSAILLSFLFQPLKKAFDKVTNTYFYKDAYDVQSVLDRTTTLLISSLDIDEVLLRLNKLLVAEMKVEWIIFVVNENPGKERIIPSNGSDQARKIQAVKKALDKTGTQTIVFNELEQDSQAEQLLSKYGIQFCTSLILNERLVGYVITGEKKSGVAYTNTDTRLLKIISSEVALCVQNALRFEEIKTFNITLQQKVNEATRQLRKANTKLVALDETKDDFISMASHQLRTPLTSVKGYLSMVVEGDAGEINPMQHKMLDQAFLSSQRMVFLIADLLNVSRLKTGKFVIERSRIKLCKMIQDEIDQLRETAKSRKLTVTFDKPAHFPEVMLDETKTRQVVMNFIDNAIYYTPTGGNITITLKETAASIEMRVKDNGIGVPKQEQQHLFTKFYRAGNARRARPDGTGLGLFMAKKIIVAQGGAILFESKEGKGSTFGFVLPKSKLQIPKA